MAKQRPHPGEYPESPSSSQYAVNGPATDVQAYEADDGPLREAQIGAIRRLADSKPAIAVLRSSLVSNVRQSWRS